MTVNDDRELRDRFVALRDEEANSAPPLSRVLRRRENHPAARRPRSLPVAALVTAAVVTATVLVLKPHGAGAGPSVDEAIAEAQSMSSWIAPTDEWLTPTDLEIPDSVPSLSLSSVSLPDEPLGSTPPQATPQGDVP